MFIPTWIVLMIVVTDYGMIITSQTVFYGWKPKKVN